MARSATKSSAPVAAAVSDSAAGPAPTPADLDPIAVEAVRAVARLSRVLERASSELSLANYRVLAAIGAGDERASRVGRKLALGKPTVSATVDSLCARGLVRRSSVGDDQRAIALSLTQDGQDVLERVERAMVERIADLCERSPDSARLLDALSWLGPAIDASLAGRSPADRSPAVPAADRPASTPSAR